MPGRLTIRDRIVYLLFTRRPLLLLQREEAPEIEKLVEIYKRSIMRATGVKPEDINEEVIRRWAIHWLRAMVKPEAWEKYGLK